MEHLRYIQATISDIVDILEIIRRSKSHFHKSKENYVNDFVEIWGPRAYYVEDNFLYIALSDDVQIGVIGMRAPNSTRTFAELDLLFVDDKYIGKGYGRLFWSKVLMISKEQGWKSFRFISDNLPQIEGFYKHMGAKEVDRIVLQSGNFPVMEYQIV